MSFFSCKISVYSEKERNMTKKDQKITCKKDCVNVIMEVVVKLGGGIE